MEIMRLSSHKNSLVLLGVLLLTVLAYLPGVSGSFVFDDTVNILQNKALEIHNLGWSQLAQAALSSEAGPLKRPLSMLSFAFNVYWGGLDPEGFKWVNLIIHLLNGILVFMLMRQVVNAWQKQKTIADTPIADWLPVLVAAIWLVHPLNLTAVLYVVQRETSLCSLFILAGCNLYLSARRRQLLIGHRRAWIWLYAGTAITFLLALASKETGVLLPVYLLVLEWCVLKFNCPSRNARLSLGLFYALYLVTPLILGLVWLFGLQHAVGLGYSGRPFTLTERLFTESRVIWLYIRWTLFPTLATLGLYHDDIRLSTNLLSPITTLPSIAGLVVLLVSAWILRRRWPWFTLGIAWFFTGQLLESTIFPLEIAFEHRNYLADLGVLFALLGFILLWRPKHARMWLRTALTCVLIVLYAGITAARAYEWRNPLSLARAEAMHHPESPYATYGYGQELANLALADHKELMPEASAALQHAASVPGASTIPLAALALLESQINGKVESDVFNDMAQHLGTQPISASDQQGLQALVECEGQQHCHFLPDTLPKVFEAALANPGLKSNPGTHANLLVMYGNYISHAPGMNLEKSRELMQQAANLVPSEPQYRINVVLLDIALNDPEQAERDLEQVQRLNRVGSLDEVIFELQSRIHHLVSPQP